MKFDRKIVLHFQRIFQNISDIIIIYWGKRLQDSYGH